MKNDFASRSKTRAVLAFVLYLCVIVCALCIEFMSVTANPKTFVNEFTNSTYIENMRSDIAQYTKDLCNANSVSDDFVDNLITYDNIYKIENAYISGALGASQEFSSDAYTSLLTQLKENTFKSLKETMMYENVLIEQSVSGVAFDTFAQSVADYAGDVIEFNYAEPVKNFCDRSRIACSILIAVSIAVSIGVIIALFKNTSRKYRATRNISYAFLSSTVMNLIVLAAVALTKATKQLVIYPTYLVDVFMRWLNDSMCVLAVGSLALTVLFAAFACVTWKLKHDSNK